MYDRTTARALVSTRGLRTTASKSDAATDAGGRNPTRTDRAYLTPDVTAPRAAHVPSEEVAKQAVVQRRPNEYNE